MYGQSGDRQPLLPHLHRRPNRSARWRRFRPALAPSRNRRPIQGRRRFTQHRTLCKNLHAQLPDPTRKLPLVVFFHGGAFCIYSPFATRYHDHVATIAAEANAVVLSVHYRRATEHLLPIAFGDAWKALRWAAAHCGGNGPEAWLNDHADFGRVFVVGASAGATLAQYTVRLAGVDGLSGIQIAGLATVHPYFDNGEPDMLMDTVFPTRTSRVTRF